MASVITSRKVTITPDDAVEKFDILIQYEGLKGATPVVGWQRTQGLPLDQPFEITTLSDMDAAQVTEWDT